MKKTSKLAISLTAIFCNQAFGYLIECKGIDDKNKEVRFMQQEDNLPVLTRIQTRQASGGLNATLRLDGVDVQYRNGIPFQLNWLHVDYKLSMIISQDRFEEDRNIRPLGYKSKIYFEGSNNPIINNEDFVCRYFQF